MHSIFYSIPIMLLFALCYAGTRHEEMGKIVVHAAKFSAWTFFFMGLVVLIVESILFLK